MRITSNVRKGLAAILIVALAAVAFGCGPRVYHSQSYSDGYSNHYQFYHSPAYSNGYQSPVVIHHYSSGYESPVVIHHYSYRQPYGQPFGYQRQVVVHHYGGGYGGGTRVYRRR